jgi:hypothetical protein
MAHNFGSSDVDTGVFGSTKGTDKFGIFGSNEATSPPTGGGAGGAGVFGLTMSPGSAGVFGANNTKDSKGVGVQGNGPEVGVQGFSKAGIGVRGFSEGVTGGQESGVGVFGQGFSQGVFGQSDQGVGVQAESNKNTALVATCRGNKTAAFIVNQWGTGDIIVGRDTRNAEVFRVLESGDVQVRGITITSDGNAKANFSSVNTRQILESLVCVPITKWNYKTDPANVQHVGPTAKDFQTAFGLNGNDDAHISIIDEQGVALAAIQGLNEKLNAENTQLRSNLNAIEARLEAIESKYWNQA